MKKGGIITLSIIIVLTALIGVLFGAVFRLRSQTVTIVGENAVNVKSEDIISAASIKSGKSIFMLNKDQAINNIETAFPYVKVLQIKTTSLKSVDIIIRARREMFYTEIESKYFILDEDLKVLNIIEANSEDEDSNEPVNLTYIDNQLNINESTKVCDFVGSDLQRKVINDLYHSMINVVTKTEGSGENEKEVYFSRNDVCSTLKEIKFEKFSTFDKMILVTNYGVQLDIENPTCDLLTKINICFSTIKEFLSNTETKNKAKEGIIKIYYDLENEMKYVYINPNTENE